MRNLSKDRTKRVIILLVMLFIMSITDLFFTLWAHYIRHFQELNPFAKLLLDNHAIFPLVISKICLTSLGIMIFWSLRRYLRAEVGLWLCIILYTALTIRWVIFATN